MGKTIGKAMLSGNEAIARGAYEAGVHIASAYPGTPSTEILETMAMYKGEVKAEWAPNEKVAMEVAGGAAIAGAKALCAQKHVGLNVAADPFFSLAYAGVTGALVVVTADDPGMHSSQNEQDNRHFARAAKVPLLEPTDSQEALEMTKIAFEMSHDFDTLVLLRTTTRISHGRGVVEISEREVEPVLPYVKDFKKFVLMPSNSRPIHLKIEEKLKKLKEYAENFKYNTIELNDKKLGIITSGISYQYAKEVFPNASFLKLGMSFPFPMNLVKKFVDSVDEVLIIEEGDDFLEGYVRQIHTNKKIVGKDVLPFHGEMLPEVLRKYILNETKSEQIVDMGLVPDRPPVLCAGCPHLGIFDAIKKQKLTVNGDIGCYTLAALSPWDSMDTCICMGASISAQSGFNNAGIDPSKNISVIGDSTFIHSGITSLIDMVYNQRNATVVILDNRITGMTGQQQNPTTGLTLQGDPTIDMDIEAICKAVGVKWVKRVDNYDMKATAKALRDARKFEGVSVLITSQPCVLTNEVKKTKKIPYIVIQEECTSCNACFKLGCPAISKNDLGKAEIDPLACIGCDLCAQICHFDAMKPIVGVK
jgi:indolepyruvate ferredoxin oxidoreductase alpha subunit